MCSVHGYIEIVDEFEARVTARLTREGLEAIAEAEAGKRTVEAEIRQSRQDGTPARRRAVDPL
jgi:hypothetical protein